MDGMSGSDERVSQEISGRSDPQGRKLPVQAPVRGKAGQVAGEVGVSRSSVEARESTTRAEPRGGTCVEAHQSNEGPGDGWEQRHSVLAQIRTPSKVRKLQRTLYRKAKAATPKANRRTTPAEPYAGKPPVRFDEGRREITEETGNCGRFNSSCLTRLLYFRQGEARQGEARRGVDA